MTDGLLKLPGLTGRHESELVLLGICLGLP